MQQVLLADRTGWTMDYIESLDEIQFVRILKILDAVDKGRAYNRKTADNQ